jgi:hypothetical protein
LTLDDLRHHLRRFIAAEIGLAELHGLMTPILAADPLDIEESADAPWESSPDQTRLLWRLIYLFESGTDEVELRTHAARIVACHEATRDAAVTYELLPLLLDQDRIRGIIGKHVEGIISRTGFLSVVTESGYPAHVKLWLERASVPALERLAARLASGAYAEVAQALERRPA